VKWAFSSFFWRSMLTNPPCATFMDELMDELHGVAAARAQGRSGYEVGGASGLRLSRETPNLLLTGIRESFSMSQLVVA